MMLFMPESPCAGGLFHLDFQQYKLYHPTSSTSCFSIYYGPLASIVMEKYHFLQVTVHWRVTFRNWTCRSCWLWPAARKVCKLDHLWWDTLCRPRFVFLQRDWEERTLQTLFPYLACAVFGERRRQWRPLLSDAWKWCWSCPTSRPTWLKLMARQQWWHTVWLESTSSILLHAISEQVPVLPQRRDEWLEVKRNTSSVYRGVHTNMKPERLEIVYRP